MKADTELVSKIARPNPRRVAAGHLNRAKRGGLTPECLERLRKAALQNQPWKSSTGPRTVEGKANSALNGKTRQIGMMSVRAIRAELASLKLLIHEMTEARELVLGVKLRDDRNSG